METAPLIINQRVWARGIAGVRSLASAPARIPAMISRGSKGRVEGKPSRARMSPAKNDEAGRRQDDVERSIGALQRRPGVADVPAAIGFAVAIEDLRPTGPANAVSVDPVSRGKRRIAKVADDEKLIAVVPAVEGDNAVVIVGERDFDHAGPDGRVAYA